MNAKFIVAALLVFAAVPASFAEQYGRGSQSTEFAAKPIGVFFALVGLYLHFEKGFTGREVQRAHMQLAKRPEPWPVGKLPVERGDITARDVLAVPAGLARDAMIHEWARSVWKAYAGSRGPVSDLLRRRGIV